MRVDPGQGWESSCRHRSEIVPELVAGGVKSRALRLAREGMP